MPDESTAARMVGVPRRRAGTPSPRRRAASTRPHQQETNRDAGPAPGARPSGTWPCSGPWPPSPSSGARPSPRPRGRRARTCELTGGARARGRGQLDGVARAPPLRTTLICSGSILCSCAPCGRRPRATASQRCFFHSSAAIPPRRAGPGGPAPRVGGGSRGEAAQNSVSDAARAPIHGHGRPGDAARREGRGAAGKGEDDRGLHTANLPPAIFVEQEPRRYEHKPMKGRARRVPFSH